MPTVVVTGREVLFKRWAGFAAIFFAGWCLGAVTTANMGASVAAAKYENNCVPLKEYYRLADEYERFGEMYTREHNQNAKVKIVPPRVPSSLPRRRSRP